MFKWDLTPIILLPDIKIDSPRCWGPSCTHLIYLFLCKSSIMRQLIQFAQIFLLLLVFFSSAFHGIFRFLLCSRTMMMMMWIIFFVVLFYTFFFSHLLFILEIAHVIFGIVEICFLFVIIMRCIYIQDSLIGVLWLKRIFKGAKGIIFSICGINCQEFVLESNLLLIFFW